jgi:NAD-dependent deacetylase
MIDKIIEYIRRSRCIIVFTGAGIATAEPTHAHHLLARLEHERKVLCVITQNIDSLHRKAGSGSVIELHGHLRTGTYLRCGERTKLLRIFKTLKPKDGAPRCEFCRGIIKPDVILFGDPMPMDELAMAYHHAKEADLFLVMGSSLTVMPAGHLGAVNRGHGARFIIINSIPTLHDPVAEIVIHDDLDVVSEKMAETL